MNDQIRALIFEVCNDWVSRGNLYTDDIHECFLNSTGDKGKYSFALDALAKMALAAAPVPQAPSVPDGWQLVRSPISEEMHVAAVKVLHRAHGVDGLPQRMLDAMLAAAPQPERSAYRSQALDDVLAERRRQIEVEGWTPEHDDEHKEGEMAVAAGYYALQCGYPHDREISVPTYWPWDAKWWKPRDKRRNMIKSVALGLAEIERMDRAERSAGDERGAS